MLTAIFSRLTENGNQQITVDQVIEQSLDENSRKIFNNKVIGYHQYFEVTGSDAGKTTFRLWPHIFNAVRSVGANEYVGNLVSDASRIATGKESETLQMIVETNRSVIATNQSVRQTNSLQKKILWLTVTLSALTLLMTSMEFMCKDETVNVAPLPVVIKNDRSIQDSAMRPESAPSLPRVDSARHN